MAITLVLVLLGGAVMALSYLVLIRPRLLTWGATADEISSTYPGDELIGECTSGATMAATLPGPPERVWPWLVQMGGGRGGWYSLDWVDNKGAPSAERIVPEWQRLEIGQHLKGPLTGGQWSCSSRTARLCCGRATACRYDRSANLSTH